MDKKGLAVHDQSMVPDPKIVDQIIRDVAAAEILPRFNNLSADEISEKSRGEIVTVADEAAELSLSRKLNALIPESLIVGEEGIAKNPARMDALKGDAPVWIIDPVDGTQNFANGNPRFCVIIAYCHHGETLAGWIYEPITDTTVWAARGQGAWEGDKRLKTSGVADIGMLRGSLNHRSRERLKESRDREGVQIPAKMTRYSCVGAEYADMARDNLQFARYAGRLKPWDHAAGILIHTEAGGYNAFTDTETPYQVGPELTEHALIVAPSAGTWRQLTDLIRNYG